MDSKRLPNKAFKLIGKRTLIGHVLERARVVKGEESIVIVTSKRKIDDPLIKFAKNENILFFRDSLNNVLLRAIKCCEHFGFSGFARVCADRPFHCPAVLGNLISIFKNNRYDLVTNYLKKTYPRGLTTEVISVESLKKVMSSTQDPFNLEHITNFIYMNQKKFRIYNYEHKGENLHKYNLCVDTKADLEKARWIVSKFKCKPENIPVEKIFPLVKIWEKNS